MGTFLAPWPKNPPKQGKYPFIIHYTTEVIFANRVKPELKKQSSLIYHKEGFFYWKKTTTWFWCTFLLLLYLKIEKIIRMDRIICKSGSYSNQNWAQNWAHFPEWEFVQNIKKVLWCGSGVMRECHFIA